MPGTQEDPVAEILAVFASDGELVLDRLEQAARRAEAATVVAEAHRLKGAAANVGASSLASHLKRVEQAGREGILTDADLDAVRPLFQRTLEALATYLD